MKRLLAGTRLIFLILGMVCLAVLALMFWAGQPASASQLDSAPPVGVAAPPKHGSASNPLSSYGSYLCTLAYTTTADSTGQGPSSSFGNAVPLASRSNLSLVGTGGPYATITQAVAFDEYFYVDGYAGANYSVLAVPNTSDGYNLGIIVYNSSYTPILSDTNAADNDNATVDFTLPATGRYYFTVVQLLDGCRGGTYNLTVGYTGPASPTPTTTSTPSVTPSPTNSPTPTSTPRSWTFPDQYDISPSNNDTITNAVALGASTTSGLTLYNATLYPADPGNDQDWYIVYGSAGYQYTVSAAPDSGYVYPYMFMELVAPDKVTRVDQVTSSNNPSISWTANSSGSYYVHIARASGSPTSGTYHVTWASNAPTATPTPGPGTPTDTPVPGLDAFEPNWDFDHAAGIGLNVKYTSINFVPLPGQSVNNDYFRVRVKGGMLVTCETLDLSSGTDTNMILYDNNRQGLAGNDDVDRARGELRSRVTVSINYDGFLYILVGQGYAVPNSQAAQYTYSLQCTVGAGQVTATPTVPAEPTSAPVFVPTPLPLPSTPPPPSATSPATAMPPISVRALPTPTPAGPVQQMVTADLQVYYDANDNGVADPGEGVVGLPARVYDATTGALLAQGFTDATGHAVFSVPAAGPVRVLVPYLGFEATVPPSGAAIPVLISPRELPKQIP